MDFQFMKKIRETITRNASNTIYKAINKIQQDNQQEGGIHNQVGNNRDELYCNILQDRLSWDKGDVIPDKSELLICFHRPRIQPIRKTWRNISKERQSYDRISWRYWHVPSNKTINIQKGRDIIWNEILPQQPRKPSTYAWISSASEIIFTLISFDDEYYKYHGGKK